MARARTIEPAPEALHLALQRGGALAEHGHQLTDPPELGGQTRWR